MTIARLQALIDYVATIAKAVVAYLAPVLTYVGTQLQAGDPINWTVAASYLISAALVWGVPNR